MTLKDWIEVSLIWIGALFFYALSMVVPVLVIWGLVKFIFG